MKHDSKWFIRIAAIYSLIGALHGTGLFYYIFSDCWSLFFSFLPLSCSTSGCSPRVNALGR